MAGSRRSGACVNTRLIGVLALALLAPIAAHAQPAPKVARIGYLLTGALDSPET